jgi:hypothetical protein
MCKIHINTENRNRVTKCIFLCSLAVVRWGGRDDNSIGFVQAKSSFVKFVVFLEKLKDIIYLENNIKNLICVIIIIIISLLGIFYCI